VEILPSPDAEEAAALALVEASEQSPFEVGPVAIETASLPALAGDPSPQISDAGAEPSPPHGELETLHHPPAGGEPSASEPIQPEAPRTAESEQGGPYVGETERVLETVSIPPEPQKESQVPVQTVTEKPANPRRGWWQRFIQS